MFERETEYLLNQLGWEIEGAFLAGGAITSVMTSRPIRDFDLYFKSKDKFLDALEAAYMDGWCVALTDRAATFKMKDDVIRLMCFDWFSTAESIFEKFDFTTCMAAIDLDSKVMSYHPQFIPDTCKRVLRFNHNTEFPLGSAMRVKKYQARGYTIEDSEFLKVLIACSFKSPKSWDEMRSQIGGQYGEAVVMDTSKEFTLNNAIESLTNTLIEEPRISKEANFVECHSVPGSYEEAVAKIFGQKAVSA